MSDTLRKVIAVLALVAAIIGVVLALSLAFGFNWYQPLEHLPEPIFLAAMVAGILCEIWAVILIAGSILVRLGVGK